MYTKKCSGCGWEFPASYQPRKCKFCGAPITMGYCSRCGKWKEKLRPANWMCKECETELHKLWRYNRMDTNEQRFKKWVEAIKAAPTKPLTEAEWLEACNYFGGCAYCGSPHIDARSMFIKFKDGGRYCAWNIVPACERCETARVSLPNPFSRMDRNLYRSPQHQARNFNYSIEKLQNIVKYLLSKMEVTE